MTKVSTNSDAADRPALTPSAELAAALAAAPACASAWESLTAIGQRDFIAWIESARKTETRQRRIAVALDKLARGDRRPCCYARVPLDVYNALRADPAAQAAWRSLTPDDKRDCVDWIEAAADRPARRERIAHACAKLAAGQRCPSQAPRAD